MNMCQQITGAALSAYLPTLLAENGFEGATAQIATLAPYGSAAVCMIIAAKVSDKFGNRGWPTQFGWMLLIVGFAIFLGAPTSNKPAHFVALILAETGHYSVYSLSPSHIKCSSNTRFQSALPSSSLGLPTTPVASLVVPSPCLSPSLLRRLSLLALDTSSPSRRARATLVERLWRLVCRLRACCSLSCTWD